MSRSALLRAAQAEATEPTTEPTPVATEPTPAATEPAPAASFAPLSEAQTGRDEARARFVADASGESTEPAPAVVEREATPGAADTAPAVRMTAQGMAEMGVGLLDALAQAAGPRFIGGGAAGWALSEGERKAVESAAVPVVELYGAQSISPEWLLLGTLAVIYLPRAVAAMNEAAPARAPELPKVDAAP